MKGFDYEKFKSESSEGNSWGSYSDLFMVLSFVFLMMYVVSSLRSGTSSIYQRIEKQKVARENDDLKAQIKAYNALKDSALQEESKDEQQVYNELMDKLSLLQDEAKEEKKRLRKEARENEKKEMALNKYQQVVRNIINANLLAKNKLKVREEIIDRKNTTITDLNQEIEVKREQIEQNRSQIDQINTELAKNIERLKKSQKTSKLTKKKAEEQIAKLRLESQKKIKKLEEGTKVAETQLAEISSKLDQTERKLEVTETELVVTSEKLKQTEAEARQQIEAIQNQHAERMDQERREFESKLAKEKLTAKQKAQQLEEFNRKVREKDRIVSERIAGLQEELTTAQERESAKAAEAQKLAQELSKSNEQLQKTESQYQQQLKQLQADHDGRIAQEKKVLEQKLKAAKLSAAEKAQQLAEFNRKVALKEADLKQQMTSLKGELAQAQEKANARAKLAREIAQALKSAGVEADVNPSTGDVLISFGRDYFDHGSAELKESMSVVLNKFVPKYSSTLFKDPKIASKITSVDIIGFASPTYGGKYIDPQSLDPQDQKAAKFNLDLSYKRARAIFDYMFDTKKISYEKQRELLPLVKVTGRSFFTEGRAPAGVTPGMGQREFCEKVDCKQAQKVIIKFNMDDKSK